MLSKQPKSRTQHDIFRIEVKSKLNYRGRALHTQLQSVGIYLKEQPKVSRLFFLEGDLTQTQLDRIAETFTSDPITETHKVMQLKANERGEISGNNGSKVIEVAFKPGVTDNVAAELLQGVKRLKIPNLYAVTTGIRYDFFDPLTDEECHNIANQFLVNNTIQRYSLGEISPEFIHSAEGKSSAGTIPLIYANSEELISISKERRLALNQREMEAIQENYKREGREPTDAELETIAQTWSEHCVHKTFKATITLSEDRKEINGLLKTYLQAATQTINAPWVRSAFVDNAGVIAFDDEYDISFKVETHNHPSAIEPFGGANTGVGGVVRDVLGVSHRPIANTNILCFGPQEQSFEDLPSGVLHPSRIKKGVVKGIEDYGNKLGLPTVNGAVLYHYGYTSNPLVYCGCVGIGPIDSHPTEPQSGDLVIVIGGRTGRDGIRGATFSSLSMDAQTGEVAGASVQIGDPITEKGLIEVVEQARDKKLYSAITDCGAGGLSSAVGEMSESIGVIIDLASVPLKYAGLDPWEIWLSEAQERMVLAVPPKNLNALQTICDTYWVELSVIGEFVESGRLEVNFEENRIVDLDNNFLHHGIPDSKLSATIQNIPTDTLHHVNSFVTQAFPKTEKELLMGLLAHPNIASKENIIRRYDHEVRGSTVIKPLIGIEHDGPSDASVLKPANTKGWKGFVLANGINPFIGEVDPYNMAISVVDEAIRNAVAVGGDPTQTAILDNFCWGDPTRPGILGGLIKAAEGCHDAAIHYQTPFISGKDSLNNEYIGNDGIRRAIPGTLLISSLSIIPDIRHAVTMDLKSPGDQLYLIGEFQPALAGSHALLITGGRQKKNNKWDNVFFGDPDELTKTPGLSELAPKIYQSLHKAIKKDLIKSAHDLSEGGLGVTAAEMSLAGRLGVSLDITCLHSTGRIALFAETNGCLLVAVDQTKITSFENEFVDLPFIKLGEVIEQPEFSVRYNEDVIFNVSVMTLVAAFTGQR